MSNENEKADIMRKDLIPVIDQLVKNHRAIAIFDSRNASLVTVHREGPGDKPVIHISAEITWPHLSAESAKQIVIGKVVAGIEPSEIQFYQVEADGALQSQQLH